jgi:hypothetical protein
MYELIYVCIYVTRCMNSLYELDECCYQQIVFCFRLCLLLQTKCRLCFLSNSNGWADVSKPVVTMDSSSDRQMKSARPSLLWATIVMVVFSPSLLSYHCSDTLIVMGQLLMATVTYDPLLQCLIIVVWSPPPAFARSTPFSELVAPGRKWHFWSHPTSSQARELSNIVTLASPDSTTETYLSRKHPESIQHFSVSRYIKIQLRWSC